MGARIPASSFSSRRSRRSQARQSTTGFFRRGNGVKPEYWLHPISSGAFGAETAIVGMVFTVFVGSLCGLLGSVVWVGSYWNSW